MASEPTPVAVWYHGLADDDDVYAGLQLFSVIYRLMGDFFAAETIVLEGKGVVIGPVFREVAEIAVKWIQAVGGVAHIDDGYYVD